MKDAAGADSDIVEGAVEGSDIDVSCFGILEQTLGSKVDMRVRRRGWST